MLESLEEPDWLFRAGRLVDHTAQAVGYADDEVQMAACYIWAQLYGAGSARHLPTKLSCQLGCDVLQILISTQCSELLLNGLGSLLLKSLLYLLSMNPGMRSTVFPREKSHANDTPIQNQKSKSSPGVPLNQF